MSTAYELEATFRFPQRVFLSLGPLDDPRKRRTLQFRSGNRAWQVDSGHSSSIEFEPDQAARLMRRLDLRLAALLWPEAYSWKPLGTDGEQLAAELCSGKGKRTLGSLRAFLAEGADRPSRISVLDPTGEPQEALLIRSWREERGRLWPDEMDFATYSSPTELVPVWTETLEQVETRVKRLEAFFLPPDRRPGE